jgi:hypothetical protein
MKKLIFLPLILILFFPSYSQVNKADILSNQEKENNQSQNSGSMAILKTSSRLFAEKEDLTSVILVIPSGDTVSVISADSIYLKVNYRGNDGYILNKHALIKSAPSLPSSNARQSVNSAEPVYAQDEESLRFGKLVNKYGKSLADKLYAGKIWKGMDSEMVKDSWGSPARINRIIKGNRLTEEWAYRNTWLYFENNILYQWGPARN